MKCAVFTFGTVIAWIVTVCPAMYPITFVDRFLFTSFLVVLVVAEFSKDYDRALVIRIQ